MARGPSPAQSTLARIIDEYHSEVVIIVRVHLNFWSQRHGVFADRARPIWADDASIFSVGLETSFACIANGLMTMLGTF